MPADLMRIRLKKNGFLLGKRMDSLLRIDDIIIKENLLNPTDESIAIYLRGAESSGILTLGEEEAERLVGSLKNKTNLVKKFRKIRD